MITTLDIYQIQVTNRIVGSGSVFGSISGVTLSPAVNAAIAANGNQLDPDVLKSGQTGIEIFSNGVDTMTRGADLVFDFPVTYDFGKIDYSVGATYNKTEITKLPSGLAAVPGQPLYDIAAVSDLTTATPLYVINFGALWTYDKLSVNLIEKLYGASSEYEGTTHNPDDKQEYFYTRIGVSPITNLDISYQVRDHVQLSVGATNLFNKFPNLLNAQYRADVSNFKYGSNASASQTADFSPYGINGGFYYIKGTLKW
jgi:iron complex outermembrane receptor protein